MSELNELSRKTLKSYVSKANKDFKKNVKIDDHDTIHTSNPRKYMKRSEMIDAAKDKLQEESMNELNENMHKNVNSPEEQHKHVLKIHKSLTGSGYTPETEKHLDVKNHTSNSNIHHVTYTSPGKKNKVLQYGKAGFPTGHHAGLLDSKHMKESVEELDELSKATLGSYIKRASSDAKAKGYDAGFIDGDERSEHPTAGFDTDQKAHKRLHNVNKAVNKIVAKESVSEQTLDLIDAIESGKSTAIETSFNEIMANKLVSAIDIRRQEIASGLFDMQEETVEEGVVPGSVKKDAKGNVLSFTTAPEDKRPDYQKKSFHELAMGANKAHVKMVAAKKRESGALPSDSANVRNLISQGR